ncbi:MAG: hypothetical protein R2747_23855 [Pyrinomonadaceae bacterium]
MAISPFLLFLLFDEPAIEVTGSAPLDYLWYFLPAGYLVTILIETPILLFGLPPKLTLKQKALCGVWLTACTYPVVVLVLPMIFLNSPRGLYIFVAEIFAPLAECFLFWVTFRTNDVKLNRKDWIRSMIAIIVANLASFGLGEILNRFGWFGLF